MCVFRLAVLESVHVVIEGVFQGVRDECTTPLVFVPERVGTVVM